jgi:hypothetical protein
MTETPIEALQQHARVEADDGEVRAWLTAPRAFLVVAVLILLGSLATEAFLIDYALTNSGLGAWSIVVIVTIWLFVATLMLRYRWRAIRSTPTLRLSDTTLTLASGPIPRAAITSISFVERRTYSAVEITTSGGVTSIVLGRPEQGPPLVALLELTRSAR